MSSTPGTVKSTTLSYFDQEASGWSNRYQLSRHFQARLNQALSWLPPSPGPINILDFGCGSGVLATSLFKWGHQVTAVDASEEMIRATQAAFEAEGIPKSQYKLEHLSREDGQGEYLNHRYQAIYSLGVLEYVPEPQQLLAHWAKVLEPKGLLILSLPNRASVLRRMERFVFQNAALFSGVPACRHLTGPDSYLHHQKHQFTLTELDNILEPLGFTRQNAVYKVTPERLKALEGNPLLGMTFMVRYQKL